MKSFSFTPPLTISLSRRERDEIRQLVKDGWENFSEKPSGAYAPPPLLREALIYSLSPCGIQRVQVRNESYVPICLVLRVGRRPGRRVNLAKKLNE